MSIFKFKQFEVDQSNCAMRINTDGVLVAAMAYHDSPEAILDIGTGTGVMALMLAQRFPEAQVSSVEIDQMAAQTAFKNFEASIFKDRLEVENISIEKYRTKSSFDLIVTNPPFFINDLKNKEERKGIARHADSGFFSDLIAKVAELLKEKGCFWFVLPVIQADLLVVKAKKFGLVPSKTIHLHSDAQKPEFRRIVCLSRNTRQPEVKHFYIYEQEKVYTAEYKALLKDFFLAY